MSSDLEAQGPETGAAGRDAADRWALSQGWQLVNKERPLLMSGPLVLATLAGRKTQTRRLPRPGGYGQPGDRLWVRETYAAHVPGCEFQGGYSYRADHRDPRGDGPAHPMKWRPSIHMPRAACRLVLEILEVRTEPLQAITDKDIAAEGLHWSVYNDDGDIMDAEGNTYSSPRAMFAGLWDKINGSRSPWASNPEVTVITFRVLP